jgi:diguanylate cyclase (GGDEF)-like protein
VLKSCLSDGNDQNLAAGVFFDRLARTANLARNLARPVAGRQKDSANLVKRIPINYHEFLRDVIGQSPLTREEQALLDRVLQDGRSADMERAARSILDSLIERGAFAVLERGREGAFEWLRLRDPRRRMRIYIRLPLGPRIPEARHVALPLEPAARTGFRYHQVQGLLSFQGSLVSSDRVMTPRELVQRLERVMQELVPVTSATFHPYDMPSGEEWTSAPLGNGIPPGGEDLESLARRRDHMVIYPDLGKDGSVLVMGLGDEGTGWRGLLILRHGEREHFTQERVALTLLVAQHFQQLLSSSIRLQGLIFYDFLTGIYNRSYFEEQAEREIAVADRRGQSMGLVIVDIDDFKSFNTRYGYEGGDRVLATVACVLKGAVRNTDTLARYGGEEFAVILSPPLSREEAKVIADRLRTAVQDEPLSIRNLEGKTVTERVTVSLGGTLYPEGGRTLRDLWNGANRLLLEAKARGKNQVRLVGDPG